MVAFLVAIVTNYVTAQPPKWAENTLLVWSVFVALALVSLGLPPRRRRRVYEPCRWGGSPREGTR